MQTPTRIDRLRVALQNALSPTHLDIMDESHQHRGHGQEATHLKIIVVTDAFQNLSRVKRQQAIYHSLNPEFTEGLHAVSLHAFTPQEWTTAQNDLCPSPRCRGGTHEH